MNAFQMHEILIVAVLFSVSATANSGFIRRRGFYRAGAAEICTWDKKICSPSLAGRPTLPPNDFNELLRWMIKVGHPGLGSFGHLADVLAMEELGVKVTQVPYRGAGPATSSARRSSKSVSGTCCRRPPARHV